MHLVPAAISDSISRNSSRHRAVVQRPGMEPVMEDGTDLYATSLQLPSPPASPNQSQRDWRTNTSTRRPSLTGSQAAPTSLPFRPRSSTGPSFPLTSAFQTSMLRSGMQSTPHTSTTQRYPSITTSPPPHEPSRSGSALLGSNPQVESVTKASRPVDPFRRLSTTDIRHRHPLQASAEPSASPPSSEQRAFLYPPESLRKPQYQEAGGSSSHRQGTSVSGSIHPSQSQSSHTRSSADTTRTGPSMVVSNQQQSHVQQQQQPALVKRKDSLALRPLPLSSFLHSPPHSPPSGPTARSRSNSVRTERSLPVYIPPLDPIPPLNFEHKYSPEDPEQKEGSQRKLKP
ncbi:hypothetical protein A0H81_10523 [Grifola frondosa]|uniref:Uncharacterized protein n=1 Tax=Grifola frondosa TaxID=5627 RepID=A0A1C7LZL8_GRIFR|nr:hypothetical protein A0H81_10523 [Grifola frondosa]